MVDKTEEIKQNELQNNQEEIKQSDLEKIAEKEFKDDREDKIVKENVDEEGNVEGNKGKPEDELLASESWEELQVPDKITKGLIEMNFIKPSKIQAVVYAILRDHKDKHLVAQSQNGSGKTGAYGIPSVSMIDESLNQVQVIIFSHNRVLVKQNLKVISQIAKHTNITVSAFETAKKADLGQIVISTPVTFETVFIKMKKYSMNFLKLIVLDEADYLVQNDATRVVFSKFFSMFNQSCSNARVLFISATFQRDNYKFISQFFKKKVISIKKEQESLTLKGVRQMFLSTKGGKSKDQMIEEYLKANINNERVIIFVNMRSNVVSLRDRLNSKGYKTFILMGGDMDPENRLETVKRFNEGLIQILITTDLLSRGFDERLVKLIINYDLPVKYGSDEPCMETYLHRIGRTGRFGSKGIGLSLISENQRSKIKDIESFYKSNIEEITSMDDLITEFKKLLNEF